MLPHGEKYSVGYLEVKLKMKCSDFICSLDFNLI